jgi:hypothetical protein
MKPTKPTTEQFADALVIVYKDMWNKKYEYILALLILPIVITCCIGIYIYELLNTVNERVKKRCNL